MNGRQAHPTLPPEFMLTHLMPKMSRKTRIRLLGWAYMIVALSHPDNTLERISD